MSLSEEQVQLLRDVVADLEEKVRRVRTPAGVRRYGQPIGAVIVEDAIPSVPSTPSAPKPRASKPRSTKPSSTTRKTTPREVSVVDNESGWEALLTEESRALFDRKKTYPERYNPPGNRGYGLKDGEIETRRVRGEGPPRVRDYQTPESAGITSITEASNVEGFIGIAESGYGKPLIPAGPPRPPEYVYRVMSVDEFSIAQERGYIKSDERMNLDVSEGTVASLVSTGDFYAPVDGSDYRIVRIKYKDEDGWLTNTVDSYVKTQERIPFDRVDLYTSPISNGRAPKPPTTDYLDDEDDVVETIRLLPEETPIVPLKPNNLIDGVAVTEYNGKQAWEDLRSSGEPSDGRLEMASSMTVNRVEGTEDEGRVFTDEEEIQNYVDELLEEVGYGKRWISFTDNEDYLQNPDVKAAVSRGQTEMLDPEHPLYNKPVPVLIYRPSGISEFVLLHEVAHILEGCWKDPNHGDGHNWSWWETWGQLLKIKGLTVSRNQAQFLGASMEGMGVFDVV